MTQLLVSKASRGPTSENPGTLRSFLNPTELFSMLALRHAAFRPIGGNVFGGNPFGQGGVPSMSNAVGGYNDILAAQRLWTSFVSGLNGGR